MNDALSQIGALAGPGSTARRAVAVSELFAQATADEQVWLRRLTTGELRQGASDGVLLKAIASAAELPDEAVRRAVMLAGFAGPVPKAALTSGLTGLEEIRLRVGRPLRPMLATSAPTVAEAMARGDGILAQALDLAAD